MGATAPVTITPEAGDDPWRRARLPPLREDLALLPAPPAPDGTPCWTIHDPARNRFFRIGHGAFEVIARWGLGSPAAIAEAVAADTLLEPTPEDIVELYRFLSTSNLTQTTDIGFLARQAQARRVSWFWWLIHNYLFFRVPLVRPDRMLGATLRLVQPLYGRAWGWTVLAAGVIGLMMALRQWDGFVHSFLHFVSWEGMALSAVTLFATKTVHEFGHAYTAKRYGCRVPTMGLAFLVLWPVLYTDTSEAWRLVSRWQRLHIAAAGILAELSLAAFATLAWSFLPDGPVRSAAFLVATVTWVTTLAVNLNPFLRFDGYYLLADALDIANLQDRAFALARWRLRETLFGLGEEPPERFGPWLHRGLLLYAFATWTYRLVLFLGIAFLVYHMFFKALGLLLFAVEIGWFILRPVAGEVRAWWQRRGRLRLNGHLLGTLGVLAGLAWLLAYPFSTTVPVPAVWRAERATTLYPPFPARLDGILAERGQAVAQGTVLFRLSSPELENRLQRVRLRIDMLQAQIARQAASREGLDRVRVMEEELASVLAERQGLEDSRAQLEIRAPAAGTVVDLEDGLRPGRWVGPRDALAMLVTRERSELTGYVDEEDLGHITPGAPARFYPSDPGRPALEAQIVSVDQVSAASLDIPALASAYGGPIAVEPSADPSRRAALVPVTTVYRVTLAPPPTAAPDQIVIGVARVETPPHTLIDRFWRTAISALIREMGF